MTEEKIRKLLEHALYTSNIGGPCYDVNSLVLQIQLIIAMLDSGENK